MEQLNSVGADRRPPAAQKQLCCTELGDGIFDFSTPPVGFHEYLVIGRARAALIDTGIGVCSLRDAVGKLTTLPVTVINTHGHPDHAGGNSEFAPALMCPADFEVYEKMASREFRVRDVAHMPGGEELLCRLQPDGPPPLPAEDGEVLDLGGRRLRIIFAPGHTRGSICVFDEATGILFSGDNVQARETALREWNSATVEELRETLLRLEALRPTRLLGGHQPNDNPPELIGRVLRCAEAVLGGVEGELRPMRGGGSALCCSLDGVSICYTPHNIRRAAE